MKYRITKHNTLFGLWNSRFLPDLAIHDIRVASTGADWYGLCVIGTSAEAVMEFSAETE